MIVGVDLGKTGCRARTDGGVEATGLGAPGLAEHGGVEAALRAVRAVLDELPDRAAVQSIAVGAAGAEAAPAAARELCGALAEAFPGARTAVTSDSVAAHVGALGGRPGAVLALGTGVVALAVDAHGHRTQVDGWGPWLGDDGSGAWIGREGLRAVLLHAEGRGPGTALTAAATARFGELRRLPGTLAAAGSTARTTATFAPDVVAAAAAGDEVATDVLDRALACWVALGTSAVRAAGVPELALVGGLASAAHPTWPADVHPVGAAGDPAAGALLLAQLDDLPHEDAVVRSGPVRVVAPRTSSVDDVDVLATEQSRPDLADLDTYDAGRLVDVLLEAEATVPAALAAAAPALARAVDLARTAITSGGRLLYVGAGTPGRLAAVDAAECPPTFGVSPEQVVALTAGGEGAATQAIEGAEDDRGAAAADLDARGLTDRDLVVGITASGRTPYVLAALEHARAAGAATVAVVNNPHSPVAAAADVAVEVLTGPEVLGGSTRLKAGTAQKIVLNVVSTGAMVGAGHAYGAWMVDVAASNEKLRRRARRIVREATGADDDAALAALEASGWRTKTALVAVLAGVGADEADRLLEEGAGRARVAVELARTLARTSS